LQNVWEDMVSLNATGDPEFHVLEPAAAHRATDSHPTDWRPEGDSLERALERDTFPLPLTEDREGYYGPHHFSYWASGHRDARLLFEMADRLGVSFRDYLDFGCASGRVLRHVALSERGVNAVGCDLNRRHTDWVATYLPPQIKVFQNHSIPTLPLPDESLDVITAYSVFTHIEAFETAWLMEMRRVLRPGGVLWATIHSERTWQVMEPGWPLYDAMVHFPDFAPYQESRTSLPKDRLVFRADGSRSYSSNVFYTMDYIHRTWGRLFEIAEVHHRLPDYQDVLILRKPQAWAMRPSRCALRSC